MGSTLPLTGERFITVSDSILKLAESDPAKVQEIAASQIQLLAAYYEEVVSQSQRSFKTALGISILGFILILISVALLLATENYPERTWIAIISGIAGLLTEFIAATSFWLYSKATDQLANFHIILDRTQRHLLANSVCEGLDDKHKQIARSKLIAEIAGISSPVATPQGETS